MPASERPCSATSRSVRRSTSHHVAARKQSPTAVAAKSGGTAYESAVTAAEVTAAAPSALQGRAREGAGGADSALCRGGCSIGSTVEKGGRSLEFGADGRSVSSAKLLG